MNDHSKAAAHYSAMAAAIADPYESCGIDCRMDTADGNEHNSCPNHACGLDCELCPGTGLPA